MRNKIEGAVTDRAFFDFFSRNFKKAYQTTKNQ